MTLREWVKDQKEKTGDYPYISDVWNEADRRVSIGHCSYCDKSLEEEGLVNKFVPIGMFCSEQCGYDHLLYYCDLEGK